MFIGMPLTYTLCIINIYYRWQHQLNQLYTFFRISLCFSLSLNNFESFHLRLDEFSVILESSFILDIVGRHPSLNLVSQSLWKYRKTSNFKLAAKRIETAQERVGTVCMIQQRQNNNISLSFTQTCSFLISFLRSASYFSFWFAFVALWTWKSTSQFRTVQNVQEWAQRAENSITLELFDL